MGRSAKSVMVGVIEQVAGILFEILVEQKLDEHEIVGDWVGTSPHGLHDDPHYEDWQAEYDAVLATVDESYFEEQEELRQLTWSQPPCNT